MSSRRKHLLAAALLLGAALGCVWLVSEKTGKSAMLQILYPAIQPPITWQDRPLGKPDTEGDHTPTIFQLEGNSKRLYEKLKRIVKRAAHKEIELKDKMHNVKNYIRHELTDVSIIVQKDNAKETNEIAMSKNDIGPPGPPGIPGLDGLDGTNGAPGVEGRQGPRGVAGEVGSIGVEGKQGLPGEVGLQGLRGDRGKPGHKGFQGRIGMLGQVGDTTGWLSGGFDCPPADTRTMRLVHCNNMGCRLEVLFNSEWGTVCGRGSDANMGSELCGAFGYGDGGRVLLNYGGGQSAPPRIWLKDVNNCPSGVGDIGDCQHGEWGEIAGCTHADDIGVCCYGKADGTKGLRVSSSEFPLCPSASAPFARLRKCGYSTCLLEVKHNGEWGTVCDRGFSDTSAGVVCRSMGFPHGGKFRRAGGGSGRIWVQDAACHGDETNLAWCEHSPWGRVGTCDHSMDAGVCCDAKDWALPEAKAPGPTYKCAGGMNKISSGSTRLVACTEHGCRLEVQHNGEWGTVCDKGFTDTNAKVVCRSMGLPGGTAILRYGERYKREGYLKIWMSDVHCNGSESWIGTCRHAQWGNTDCKHGMDVGICCAPE